jgi:hypothetical protein
MDNSYVFSYSYWGPTYDSYNINLISSFSHRTILLYISTGNGSGFIHWMLHYNIIMDKLGGLFEGGYCNPD